MKRQCYVILVSLALVFCSFTLAPAFDGTIRVGLLEPLTGTAAIYGIPNRYAYEMATEDINASGGIKIGDKAYKIDLTVYDTKGVAAEGVAAFERLVTRDGIKLIVGITVSSVGLAIQPSAEQHKVLVLVTGASSPEISKIPNMYHARATTKHYAAGFVNLAVKELGVKSVCFLIDRLHPGWMMMKSSVESRLRDAGVKVVSKQHYVHNETDFYTQLTTLKSSNPDLIMMMGGYANDDTKIWRQARELGLRAMMTTHLAGTEKEYLGMVDAKFVEGFMGVTTPLIDDLLKMQNPLAIKFNEVFSKKYNQAPGFTTLSAYDGMYILAAAIKKAGTYENVEAIKSALLNITPQDIPQILEPVIPFEGRLFRPDRSVDFGVVWKRWENGQLKTIKILK